MCDIDTRPDLWKNVILSGGSTCYDGMPKRLTNELQRLCQMEGGVGVVAPEDRMYSVWKGGALLSNLTTFAAKWITKDDYDEYGTEVVHKKCKA